MHYYDKIETLYNRSTDGKKSLIKGSFRNSTVEMLKDIQWGFTEKVDDTNISVHWDGHNIEFHGRTEKASIPSDLVNKLNELFGNDGVDFILFDVMIGGNYQPRAVVDDIAMAFGIKVVPFIMSGTLAEAEEFIMTHPKSTLGDCEMEGLVGRPIHELRDRCGNRIIVKIKWCDYKQLL